MLKQSLRVKLVERKVGEKQKVARWRENVRTDDPERLSNLKKSDTGIETGLPGYEGKTTES